MEAQPGRGSRLYLLESFDFDLMHLDGHLRVDGELLTLHRAAEAGEQTFAAVARRLRYRRHA